MWLVVVDLEGHVRIWNVETRGFILLLDASKDGLEATICLNQSKIARGKGLGKGASCCCRCGISYEGEQKGSSHDAKYDDGKLHSTGRTRFAV
jgi:hypothetical protein